MLEKARDAKLCPICGTTILKKMIDAQLKDLRAAAKEVSKAINKWMPVKVASVAAQRQIDQHTGVLEVKKETLNPLLLIETRADALAKHKTKLDKLEKKAEENTRYTEAIRITTDLNKNFATTMPTINQDIPEDLEEQVDQTKETIANLTAEKQQRKMYEESHAAYTTGQQRRQELVGMIVETDRQVDLLKAGG